MRVRRGPAYLRTLLLATVALAGLLWLALDQFGADPGEIREFLMGSLLLTGGAVLAAALAVFAWACVRRILQRDER